MEIRDAYGTCNDGGVMLTVDGGVIPPADRWQRPSPKPKHKLLGDWLKEQIAARGWTRAETAARFGVSKSVLVGWTSGWNRPSSQRLDQMAAMFGADRKSLGKLRYRKGLFQLLQEGDVEGARAEAARIELVLG